MSNRSKLESKGLLLVTCLAVVMSRVACPAATVHARENICKTKAPPSPRPPSLRTYATIGLPTITVQIGRFIEGLDRHRQILPLAPEAAPTTLHELHHRTPPLRWEVQARWDFWPQRHPTPTDQTVDIEVASVRMERLCRRLEETLRHRDLGSLNERLIHEVEIGRILALLDLHLEGLNHEPGREP